MADTKISEMTAATNLTSASIPIVQGGANKKAASTLFVPCLKYVALLTQSGTDAPVATVLENTLGGTVVWTRNSLGQYFGTLSGAFTENKTIAPPFPLSNNSVFMPLTTGGAGPIGYYEIAKAGALNVTNYIVLNSYDENTNFVELSTMLNGEPILIEIRVYP